METALNRYGSGTAVWECIFVVWYGCAEHCGSSMAEELCNALYVAE